MPREHILAIQILKLKKNIYKMKLKMCKALETTMACHLNVEIIIQQFHTHGNASPDQNAVSHNFSEREQEDLSYGHLMWREK